MQQMPGSGISICNNRFYVLGSISPVWWAHGLSPYRRFLKDNYKNVWTCATKYQSWRFGMGCRRQAQI
jgi:hypothetical protein